MFGWFKKTVKIGTLVAALSFAVDNAKSQNLESHDELASIQKEVEDQVKGKQKDVIEVKVPEDSLKVMRRSGIQEVRKKKYANAIAEIQLMKNYCKKTNLGKRYERHAKRIIKRMTDKADHLRNEGNYQEALSIYKEAKKAADIGDPRRSGKIQGVIKELKSRELAMNQAKRL